jgi:hypothetical protein
VFAHIVAVPAGQDKVFDVAADDELRQRNPSSETESEQIVRLGQEALARLRRGWADWLAIAEALQLGRTEVMAELHTNKPTGKRYETAMAKWLAARTFDKIDKGARSRLLECLKHKVEIEAWRSRLTDGERLRFNHPETILRKWRKATVVPDLGVPKKPTPMQKLKDELVAVIEERDRYKREIERGSGNLRTPEDRIADLARDCRGLLKHFEQHKDAIHKKLSLIIKLAARDTKSNHDTKSNVQAGATSPSYAHA